MPSESLRTSYRPGGLENASHSGRTSTNSSDENEGEWFPGDGVCPSSSEFSTVYQAAFRSWTDAANSGAETNDLDGFAHIEPLLAILQDVPDFLENAPQDIEMLGKRGGTLSLRAELHLTTTDHPECEQKEKVIEFYQVLATSKWATFELAIPEVDPSLCGPNAGTPIAAVNLTNISLAWSYIISCIWVETLQRHGENCSMRHPVGPNVPSGFWDLVIGCHWEARIQRKKAVFYCPWMLRQEGLESQRELIDVPPNSSLAFEILLDFCMNNYLEEECILGLATVLLLRLMDVPRPKLTSPARISNYDASSNRKDVKADRLFRSLRKCMFLSSTHEALDSLLCSVFFDPTVICNLRGAMALGVQDALQTDDCHNTVPLKAISSKAPYLAPFWKALVHNGQAQDMLNRGLSGLPPLCLPAALWTNTLQSFLQVKYTCGLPQESISRALEFSTSCFVRPEASIPWSPAPPFGSASVDNLSLIIREHIGHQHSPLRWTIYWILKFGGKVAASPEKSPTTPPHVILECPQNSTPVENPDESWAEREKEANERSWDATSRLFNWHRDYDDGLWLAGATTNDIESTRKLQCHPWIANPWDDGGRHSPAPQQNGQSKLDERSILEWVRNAKSYFVMDPNRSKSRISRPMF